MALLNVVVYYEVLESNSILIRLNIQLGSSIT